LISFQHDGLVAVFSVQYQVLLGSYFKLNVEVDDVENQIKLVEINFNFECVECLSGHFDEELVFEKLGDLGVGKSTHIMHCFKKC